MKTVALALLILVGANSFAHGQQCCPSGDEEQPFGLPGE